MNILTQTCIRCGRFIYGLPLVLLLLSAAASDLSAAEQPNSLFRTLLGQCRAELYTQLTDLSQTAPAMMSSIGNYTFKDCDGDGIQDPNIDSPLQDVRVYIEGTTVGGMSVLDSTLSDMSGFYAFAGLEAGTYTLFFDFPEGKEGFAYSPKNEGLDTDMDSDIDQTTGMTDPITLGANETRTDIDAGFVDVQGPQPQNFVDPLIVSCSDTIPDLVILDNCTPEDELNFIAQNVITQAEDSCEVRIKRTFIVTDDCGNLSSICQTVIQRDTTPPIAPASDTLVLCIADTVNLPPPMFTDDCDEFLEVTFDEEGIVPVSNCELQIQRMYTATDNCGNTAQVVQTITVLDTAEVNVIFEPEPAEFDCMLGLVTAPQIENSCGDVVPLTQDTVITPGGCANQFTVQINYTSADECYNYSFTHNITVTDDTAPVLDGDAPSDVTIECGADVPPLILTFTDDCGTVTQTPTETTADLPCGFVVTQTVTAEDECGNSVSVSREVTVTDTTAPELMNVPADDNADCEGTNDIPPPPNVTATDNCDGNVPVQFNEMTQDMACEGTFMIVRTWTATDDCGNTVSESQIITVGDDGPPVISGVPADDQTVECELPPVPDVTATDNCGTVSLEYAETAPGDPCQDYTVTRTWTATDDCGNVSTASYTVTVQVVGPTLNPFEGDLVFACDETVPDPTPPTITPGCFAVTYEGFAETETPGDCPQEFTLLRKYNYTDECGNEYTVNQNISVVDTVGPVITIIEPTLQGLEDGDSLFVECDAVLMMNEQGATATDNCDEDVQVQFMEMAGENAECVEDGYIAHMICGWKAEDDCGNLTTLFLNIFIVDSTPPMLFGVPDDVTLSCEGEDIPVIVSAMDNCEFVLPVEMTETESGTPCNRVIVRKWTATDQCGNMTMASQTVTITDDTAPVLTGVPEDVTVECNEIPAPADVTAEDNCDPDSEVVFTEDTEGDICVPPGQIIVRTWTATDNCGNVATASQTVTVQDNTPPTFPDLPVNLTVECDAVPAPEDFIATDACDPDVEVLFNEIIIQNGDCEDNYTIIRNWVATDDCGNFNSAMQTITVDDTTAPTVTFVEGNYQDGDTLYFVCVADSFDAQDVTFSDNCDANPEVTFSVDTLDENPCRLVIRYRWTATDNCGNSTDFTLFTVTEDDEAPVFIDFPDDVMTDCDDLPDPEEVTATDNCGEVTVTMTETTDGGDCSDFTIIRTYTATDQCGNLTTQSQSLTVSDDEPPVLFNIPEDVTVECPAIPEDADAVTAVDNCADDPQVVMNETTVPGDCPQNFTLIRTWTATDNCGNTTSAMQTVTVEDTTPPVILGVPEDTEAACTDVPVPPVIGEDIKAVDACDPNPDLVLTEEMTGDICTDLQIIRTWTATDDCGNTATATQVISLADTEPPVFTAFPDDTVNECVPLPNDDFPTAADDCDEEVEITVEEGLIELSCGYIIIRIFTATDDCGNQTVGTQKLTVTDETPPVITGVPNDIALECDQDLPPVPVVTATDNCGEVTLETDENLTVSPLCPQNYTITYTYTATDDCGNVTTEVYTVTVQDTTAPEITFDNPLLDGIENGGTVILECDEIINLENEAIITDNCDDTPTVVFTEETLLSDDCEADGYFLQLLCTWTLTDDCGNTTVFMLTVLITDTTAPTIICPPNKVIDLGAGDTVPDPLDPAVSDNCTDEVTVTLQENIVPDADDCGYTIVRTYTAADECGNTASCTYNVTVLEFCDCPDIIVTDTTNVPATCAGNDGQFMAEVENAAAYDYVLLPGTGTSVGVGNAYTDLPTGDYLLIISQPDIDSCEVKVYFTIADGCADCETDVFTEDNPVLEIEDCNEQANICLNITEESTTDYNITLNGAAYTGSLVACDFDTLYSYGIGALPGMGSEGPYTVQNWTVNGTEYSGQFANLPALVSLMNSWDASGDWQLMQGAINGGDTGNTYGTLTVLQNGTGAIANLVKNVGTTPVGLAVQAPFGEHEFIFTHTQTGCADTSVVLVICSPLITPEIAQIILPENRTETFCLSTDELPGVPILYEALTLTNTVADFAALSDPDADMCLTISGLQVGEQQAVFAVCDDFGFCDTTYLHITVTAPIFNASAYPVAVDDGAERNEGAEIIIDVCLNDELNGTLESHSLISRPQSGRAVLEGGMLYYYPAPETCEDVSFRYEICNDMGCDEAEITLHYLCDEVVIFNGFSPNGDGRNDVFVIQGLERYPQHYLRVFNRWGSTVFAGGDYQSDWDGTLGGKDLPDGSYFYLLDTGEGEIVSGYVELRR